MYTRLSAGPKPADVLAAVLPPSLSATPFTAHPEDTINSTRVGSFIHVGPSHSKTTRPPEVRSKQNAAAEGIIIAKWVVLPDSHHYRLYWTVTVAAAFLTAIFEPFMFAFKSNPGLSPYLNPAALFEYALFVLFGADLVLNFFVAYHDKAQQSIVMDLKAIRRAYLRPLGFGLDLLGVVPLDYLVLQCMGLQAAGPDSVAASAVAALRWLRLVRCWRVLTFFQDLEFDVRISQIWVTLARNQCFLFFLLHASACTYFWIARLHRFSETSWVGSSYNSIQDMDVLSQYVFSLYWSTITFSTVGYGDLHAVSTIEAAFTVAYCFINVVVASYIIGTITVLVVKRDETTRDYRSRLAVLDAYNKEHNLPKALTQSMSDHLELHLHSAEVRDEAVLSVYPATIRRRILRYLYGPILSKCQLLAGCPPRFLDSLLAVARVEMFMSKVEILSEGDQVHDLHILMAGSLEQLRPSGQACTPGTTRLVSQSGTSWAGSDGQTDPDPASLRAKVAAATGEPGLKAPLLRQDSGRPQGLYRTSSMGLPRTDSQGFMWGGADGDSVRGGSTAARGRRRLILPGVAFGELPFFTHTPVQEAVRTLESCRVLVISRSDWQRLTSDFILAAKDVMSNLQVMCELDVVHELRGLRPEQELAGTMSPGTHPGPHGTQSGTQPGAQQGSGAAPGAESGILNLSSPSALSELQAAVYQLMYRHGGSHLAQGVPLPLSSLTPRQQGVVADLMRVRALAAAQADAADAARTHKFLSAASRGDAVKVREMLMQGQAVDVADYDDRTALMLACTRGHVAVARMLLEVGADPRRRDALGGTAALGAAKAGHTQVLQLLTEHGSGLALKPAVLAGILCRCAAEGDVPLLRHLLSAGADARVGDYDRRTALHVAAGCGNQPAVQLLLAHGADALSEDMFGSTPLDDARRCGSRAVLSLLEASLPTPEHAQRALAKYELRRAERMLQACASGDQAAVLELLDGGCPVDACDYDKRAGLELAAAGGHLGVVRLLVSRDADLNRIDRLESCALLEACKGGHVAIIDELVQAGARLGSSPQVAAWLCQAVAVRDLALLESLLRAQADPTAADYDQRTAAHIAAAEGQAAALALLLTGSSASPVPAAGPPWALAAAVRAARDRWGRTPLDEAQAGGHQECVAILSA